MKKVVLKLNYHDEKSKQKAMMKVSGLPGVESIAMDTKDKKLTVTGDIDPVEVVAKLRKLCYTEILTVGPPEKKKEEPKKEEPKKAAAAGDDKNKDEGLKPNQMVYPNYPVPVQQFHHPLYVQHPSYYRSAEEDPNSCVIC